MKIDLQYTRLCELLVDVHGDSIINMCLRRKRKRRDATGKLDYDRPADYNLPLVPHPPGNCTVSIVFIGRKI